MAVRYVRLILESKLFPIRCRTTTNGIRRAFHSSWRSRDDRHDRKGARKWASCGLVSGPHGVWSTFTRCAFDPRRSTIMKRNLNLKVKHHESFHPFAPSVLREESG